VRDSVVLEFKGNTISSEAKKKKKKKQDRESMSKALRVHLNDSERFHFKLEADDTLATVLTVKRVFFCSAVLFNVQVQSQRLRPLVSSELLDDEGGLLVLAQVEVMKGGRARKQAIGAGSTMDGIANLFLENPELHLLTQSSVIMTPMLRKMPGIKDIKVDFDSIGNEEIEAGEMQVTLF
jgi:hypothetical protein